MGSLPLVLQPNNKTKNEWNQTQFLKPNWAQNPPKVSTTKVFINHKNCFENDIGGSIQF